MPCNSWSGIWRWANREANAKGRAGVPQIQGQEKLMAQGLSSPCTSCHCASVYLLRGCILSVIGSCNFWHLVVLLWIAGPFVGWKAMFCALGPLMYQCTAGLSWLCSTCCYAQRQSHSVTLQMLEHRCLLDFGGESLLLTADYHQVRRAGSTPVLQHHEDSLRMIADMACVLHSGSWCGYEPCRASSRWW